MRSLKPRVFAFCEMDTNLNGPFFMPRFKEALRCLMGLLQASGATLPEKAIPVLNIWEVFLSRLLVNVLGCEGLERWIRSEILEQWQGRMQRLGFQAEPLGPNAWEDINNVMQSAKNHWPNEEINVHNVEGCARLLWRGSPLIFVGVWK